MELIIPTGMENFFNLLKDFCLKNKLNFDDVIFKYVGMAYLGGDEFRYQNTPPELIPFASMGVDGFHYGYVIHAPEIPQNDYPIGEFCPSDDGVILCGENTNIALENLMSFQIEINDLKDKTYKRFIKELSKHKIKPSKSKADRRYSKDGNGIMIQPKIPLNYKWIPTQDGIGSLAPINTFSNNQLEKYQVSDAFIYEKFIGYSESAIKNGFYGDALYYLKELYWNKWTNQEYFNRISKLLEIVYLELNRQVFVPIVRKNIVLVE